MERVTQSAITSVDVCSYRLLDAMALSLQGQKQIAVEYVTETAQVVQGAVTKATDQTQVKDPNQAKDPNQEKSRNQTNHQRPAVN